MGTSNRRERELARQHHLRQQQRRAEARVRERRRNQAIAAGLSVLAVIAATVFIYFQMNDRGTETATPVEPGDPAASAAPTPTPTGKPACPAPAGKAPKSPKSFSKEPKLTIDRGADYTARLATNCGDIVIDLLASKAPRTVNSFAFLAEEGYFKNSPCHRLTGETEGIFVLQCGDPTGTGRGGPGYGFGIENAPKDGRYPSGTVAMARGQDPNSNGSQFFIVYRDTQLPTEGGGYSIFGKVTKGMDVVAKIARAGVDPAKPPAPAQRVSLESVTVEQKKA